MSFTLPVSGDRFGARAGSSVPKKFATARYAAPLVGHLCKVDTTALFQDGVIQCLASDVPQYLVESVNSSNGTLSVWKLPKTVQLVFEYAGSPTLGQQIQMNDPAVPGTIKIGGTVRDKVKGVAVGTGLPGSIIVAIDQPKTGLLTVEFGS